MYNIGGLNEYQIFAGGGLTQPLNFAVNSNIYMEAFSRLRLGMPAAEKSVQRFADAGRTSQRFEEAWGRSVR
jgi:hypothetical protein